jgi:hypothetical protein
MNEFEKYQEKELQLRQIIALEKIADSLEKLSNCVVTNSYSDLNQSIRVFDVYQSWKNNL